MKMYSTKKMFFSFLTLFFMVSMLGCEKSPQRATEAVEDAKKDLQKANENLVEAKLDSSNQYNKYREDVNARLAENDRKIVAIREKMQQEKQDMRVKYEKRISELEGKNAKLKTDIGSYTKDNNKWNSFKERFDKEMDDLGKDISEISDRNTKNSE